MFRSTAAFVAALLSFALAAPAAEVREYQALRASRPDGRTVAVQNLVLTRDAFRIEFKSGTFHYLAPLGTTTFGAVFIGNGSYTLTPATTGESHHLQVVTSDPTRTTLSDTFSEFVLLFTDQTVADIERNAPMGTGAPDPAAAAVYENYLKDQRHDYKTNLQLRVLLDLLNRPTRTDGVFLAMVKGKSLAPALIAVDPLGVSNLSAMYGMFGGEEVGYFSFDDLNRGFWYLSTFAHEARNGQGKPSRAIAHAEHYDIFTTINGLKIEGKTRIRLQPMMDGVRVLPIRLMPRLRISKVVLEGPTPGDLGVIQEPLDAGLLRRMTGDTVNDADAAVVFPQALEKGKSVEISVEYSGDEVLESYGPEFYSVRARESWYPNIGTFTDLATYNLTFDAPRRNTVVSVGDLVEQHDAGNRHVTVWKSDVPIRVAGFNYGDFVKESRTDSVTGLTFDAYTNRSWTKRVGDTLVDAMNATRSSTAFFGPMPYKHLSISQQLESFGQSWPTLVYFPTVALTNSVDRAMGIGNPKALSSVNEFVKTVGWHEVAHQWWGHRVGWESYRDQWLSEGFAEFSAAVTLQFTENMAATNRFWENRREEILTKRSVIANDRAGAISDGYRSSTRYSPGAAQALIYSKGAYVLHMIRMLMREERKPGPDERFITMMQDFVRTYDGKNPSTADFQHVVERYMTPAMDAKRDGKMDYFFDQWVRGTDIPRLKSALQAEPANGKYRIHGTITQEGVPPDFITLVPVYIDFGGDRVARLALMRLVGSKTENMDVQIELPAAPRRVLINYMHDVLSRD